MFKWLSITLLIMLQIQTAAQKDTAKSANSEADLYKAALKLMDSSKYEEAIVPLKKAVKLKPDYIEAWNKLALAKLKTKDYKGAEKDLKSALKIAPDNFESRKNLGIVYYENQKFKEAKAAIDSALAVGKDDAELFYYRGKLMFDGKAYKQAQEAAKAKYDLELGWLRTMFETAERDRTIARLENDNIQRAAALRQRTLWLWLTVAVAMASMLGGWLVLQRRRQRERLIEAARLAHKEEALARYRREADALAEDRQLLQALLDSRDDAVCLLDAEGAVLAANRAACIALGTAPGVLVGAPLSERLPAIDGVALRAALERMEDVADQQLDLALADARRWRARLSQWPQGDGLIVCELSVPPTAEAVAEVVGAPVDMPLDTPARHAPDAAAEPIDADVSRPESASRQDPRLREDFRRALVELMLSALEAWERATGTGRLELAEKSRIWRVAVDDGRVRARAMERYLGVSRLPQNPRWRDVVRTGYYVLEHCAMEPDARERLQRQVDAVLAYTRRSALV